MGKGKIQKILSPNECMGMGISEKGAIMLDSYGIQQKISRNYLKKIVSYYSKFFDLNFDMNSVQREFILIKMGDKVLEELVSPEIISEVEKKDEFYDEDISPGANSLAKIMCVSNYILANVVKQKLYKE